MLYYSFYYAGIYVLIKKITFIKALRKEPMIFSSSLLSHVRFDISYIML